MGKTQHTPGPLTVGQYVPSDDFKKIELHTCVCKLDGSLVALTGPADNEIGQADAILYAAAPDLLAACKAAYHCHVFDFQRGVGVSEKEIKMIGVRDLLETAIAKAEAVPTPTPN